MTDWLMGIFVGPRDPKERLDLGVWAAELANLLSKGKVFLKVTGKPEQLIQKWKALGPVSPCVEFVGYLPRDEYDGLLASADFGLNITDEVNTVNHCLYEYNAHLLPTVSSRSPEIEQVFGDSLIYTENNVRTVADAILTLLDPEVRKYWKNKQDVKNFLLYAQHHKEVQWLNGLITPRVPAQRISATATDARGMNGISAPTTLPP